MSNIKTLYSKNLVTLNTIFYAISFLSLVLVCLSFVLSDVLGWVLITFWILFFLISLYYIDIKGKKLKNYE